MSNAYAPLSLATDFIEDDVFKEKKINTNFSEIGSDIAITEAMSSNLSTQDIDTTIDHYEIEDGRTFNTLSIPKDSPPLIHYEKRKGHFLSLIKWEGIVECLTETGFIARLKDVDGNVPDERVEIDFDELTNIDEKVLIEPGALFSWTMGYSVSPGGTRERKAILIFRRMPTWNEEDIINGIEKGNEMFELMSK